MTSRSLLGFLNVSIGCTVVKVRVQGGRGEE